MSATAFKANVAYYGCFEDVSAVIDVCFVHSVSYVAYLSGQSVLCVI